MLSNKCNQYWQIDIGIIEEETRRSFGIYIYINSSTEKLDWPLDGTAEVCRASLSFSSINAIPFFVAWATLEFRYRGPSGDVSSVSTYSSIDVLRANGTHPAARLFKVVTPIGTLASWFRMVLSFSTKPLLHSRSPRKISLGHIWGCVIFSVACQKALGGRRLASKAMSTANSPTGILWSAIFFNHYTTVFFLSQLFQLDFSYPSKQSQTTLSQDLGDQKQDLWTFLPLSSFLERIWEAQPSACILVCSHIVFCTTLWCLYLWLPNLAVSWRLSWQQVVSWFLMCFWLAGGVPVWFWPADAEGLLLNSGDSLEAIAKKS